MEEKMDLLLKNGLVVTENECKRVDIAVKNGKIAGLLERGSKTCCSEKEIDCQGKVILPGAIDTHSHFFEPGEPSKYRDDLRQLWLRLPAAILPVLKCPKVFRQ